MREDLEKGSGVGDVVANGTLGGDSDLIFVDRRLGFWLFDLLVPIHGCLGREIEREKRGERNPKLKTLEE